MRTPIGCANFIGPVLLWFLIPFHLRVSHCAGLGRGRPARAPPSCLPTCLPLGRPPHPPSRHFIAHQSRAAGPCPRAMGQEGCGDDPPSCLVSITRASRANPLLPFARTLAGSIGFRSAYLRSYGVHYFLTLTGACEALNSREDLPFFSTP
ncbi:hypothetical protein L228DRAFT_79782 [Xylona heveae TC161]|uniref:Secreted protein n=1 Tax=Xylona heveae (strain CBS 132557 / TC161) TaxID=1328760 RepID=A0A165J064_XYLHT|nr:hypothetical protein L228DRAFT_79782 [Xylona heveae TC161]KZF25609.1 hypothetical protein L228DRAFT_79782 [Xylona heveae TC161]